MATNIEGGFDGNSYPMGWTNQNGTGVSTSLESYQNSSAMLFDPPQLNGYSAWTGIPADAISTTTYGTTNTNYLLRFFVPANFSSTKADVNVTTAGSTSNVVAGIYSAAGAKLAASADLHSTWTTGINTFTWASAVTLQGGSLYYISLIVAWATTAPVITSLTTSAVANANLAAAASDFASNGTASALPATYTMASNSAINNLGKFWVAVY